MADPHADPAYEYRLVYLCGCIERFPLFNPPPPGDEEMTARDACQDCQRKAAGAIPEEGLEMMAEAADAAKRWKSKRRLPRGIHPS
jgi:hypothetical protein